MPRPKGTAVHAARTTAPTAVTTGGGTAVLERPTTGGVAGANKVIWQASPDYRLVIAPNAFGFAIQTMRGTTWQNVEAMPLYALRPMLLQFGLISPVQLGGAIGGPSNGSGNGRRARSGTQQTKTTTTSRV